MTLLDARPVTSDSGVRAVAAIVLALAIALLLPGPASAATDPSLVGAYGFEDASGSTVADNSGRGNAGTIAGAQWTTQGRFGSGLTFDGVDDLVTVPDADSLDLTTGMTLEAWVRPTELTRYRAVVMKEAATALVYALYAETSPAKPSLVVQMAGRLRALEGLSQLPANVWTHLAGTYDGGVFRLYVNGTQVAQSGRVGSITVSSGPLRIGGTLIYPEYFKGDIDEVRVYKRALTAGEIQGDMNTAVAGAPDTLPPTTPLNFASTDRSPTSISTSWTASTDDRGVERYALFVNGVPYGTTTLTSFTFDTLSCSATYELGVEARDGADNTSPRATITASTADCDTTEPTVSITAPTGGATVSGTVSVTANATDNDAVAGVQFLLDGQPLGDEDTSGPWSTPWNTRSASNGSHTLTARARDRSGNLKTSAPVTLTVENTTAPPAAGLVAGYGFDEGQGATAADASGNGNDGSIVGASWTTGKIGGALNFDGLDDVVNVADADSLDLTNGLTLSAWVRPDVLNGAWRTVIFKERPANITYGLYAQDNTPVPAGEMTIGSSVTSLRGTTQVPLDAWTNLAYTYDGSSQRLYVNGTLVSNTARTGSITTSTGALRIGGNSIWGERFDGLIDEVRVYNRALPQAEIEADMNTSVSTPDTAKPSAPSNLTATGSVGRVTLNWTPSTDDVGVTRYNVHRSTTPGFTPSAENRVAQPTTSSYVDSGLAPNTYYYRVTAEDRAGNVSDASGEANGTAEPDTEQPTVSLTAPAAGATVSNAINVTANASDNDAVKGVQFSLDGQDLGSEDTTAPYSVSWNTRLAANGPHTLAAKATDASGNTRTTADVGVTVDNTTAPPPGLVAGYGFDEGTGSTVSDASGNGNTGTTGGAAWTPIGKMGGALNFDGIDDRVNVPDSDSLDLTTGMTISSWVRPDAIGTAWRTVIFKQRDGGNLVYGNYANTNTSVPNGEITQGSTVVSVKGTSKVADGEWTHLAVTYDGAALKLFVNGTQVGSAARTGPILTSAGALHVGGNETWGEYFDGLIDEVRIYDRPLSQEEIQTDMRVGVTPDSKAPTVTAVTPDPDANGTTVAPSITATFSEAMDQSTITPGTFTLRDPAGTAVNATVTYNDATGKATLRPTSALKYGTRYTVTVEGGASGSRVKDMAGNALAADRTWSFTTEPTPPPILVVESNANPNDRFSTYVPEIMRAEGINGFSVNDVSLVDAAYLSNFDVVVLGDVPITASQATALTNWVNAGGNLIALSPDKQLAGLLGLTDTGTTLDNAYLRVNTGAAPGAGIVGESIQYHGSADRYALNGATAVATLYSDANSPTSSPAVSLRSVGTNGGQAAAFTFDLARSTSLTRQGNPAWTGIERDGFNPIRTNDLFYGATEANWVDLNKIQIPQADELQRLFANVITFTNRDRTPVPRFWYLPRDEKAAVVMTGDDHADGGTAGRFNHFKAGSPAGCSVEQWECLRMTSYIYPGSPLTNDQAAAFEAEGFEVSVHPFKAGCTNPTYDQFNSLYNQRLTEFAASYPSVPTPTTSRFHCVSWPDWDSHARIEAAHGIRLDTNYYQYPPAWGGFPGFMTGSGEIMKFADKAGATIDVYQAHTHLNDEAFTVPQIQFGIDSLLDKAVGPEGYYGMFTANMHTDNVVSAGSDAIVASAQARDVPVVSARQALRWVEGRDGSAFREFTWSGGRLGFTVTVGPGATGLRGMLPLQSSVGNLTTLTRDGAPVTLTARTIKGISYAFFNATPGRYEAKYGA